MNPLESSTTNVELYCMRCALDQIFLDQKKNITEKLNKLFENHLFTLMNDLDKRVLRDKKNKMRQIVVDSRVIKINNEITKILFDKINKSFESLIFLLSQPVQGECLEKEMLNDFSIASLPISEILIQLVPQDELSELEQLADRKILHQSRSMCLQVRSLLTEI